MSVLGLVQEIPSTEETARMSPPGDQRGGISGKWRRHLVLSAKKSHSTSRSPGLAGSARCRWSTGAHTALGGDSFLTLTSTEGDHARRLSLKAARRCMSPVPSMPGEHCHTTTHFHTGCGPGICEIIAMCEYPTWSLTLFLNTSPTCTTAPSLWVSSHWGAWGGAVGWSQWKLCTGVLSGSMRVLPSRTVSTVFCASLRFMLPSRMGHLGDDGEDKDGEGGEAGSVGCRG
mmetsp:Transcript_28838/g.72155  ORF Transcript_28838/g.72155 Transcript_28838/m.72155 type:complete len:230 (-) Transcript_28838:474-1163(-)